MPQHVPSSYAPTDRRPSRLRGVWLALVALALGACAREVDVVLYCAQDQMFAEQLVKDFEKRTGLVVRAEYDVEAAKTVGLVNRIREERARPRCDVFWNNELAHTVALANDGLLDSYDSPSAADIPESFRDPQRRWTAFAARARVFIVNTTLANPAEIRGLDDLFDPKWKDKVCMARPLTGTTLTHLVAYYATEGDDAGDAFVKRMEDSGLSLVQSNGQVMRLVREGQMAWGLTDTADFNVARMAGHPVAQVFPDQRDAEHPNARGTLLIPNSIAILKSAPHPDAARKLVDFLLSREVEQKLAESESAQIPVRANVPRPDYVKSAADLTVLQVDWAKVGADIERRMGQFKERFLR